MGNSVHSKLANMGLHPANFYLGQSADAPLAPRADRGNPIMLAVTVTYQPVEKGVIDRVSRHGEAYRGEGGFAILRDDEDDLNDQDGSSGRNKHEQGANSARHGLLRGAGADELAHQHEIVVDGALGRQVLGQRRPLAARQRT